MNVNRAFQKRVGLFRKHHRTENLHQFATFRSKDACAQDVVVRSVDDNLHEPGCFSAFNGARDMRHRTSSNLEFVAFGTSLFLRHAHAAELRIGEHAVRHEPVFCA